MGTCYRIVDDASRLYYNMDKWCINDDDLVSLEALQAWAKEVPACGEQWMVNMANAIVRDVSRNMKFPLTAHGDGGDVFHDIEEAGYRCCGERFCSYHGVSVPFDPLPVQPGTYLVWDKEPFSASSPRPDRRQWDGKHWCDSSNRPLALHAPFWWTTLDFLLNDGT